MHKLVSANGKMKTSSKYHEQAENLRHGTRSLNAPHNRLESSTSGPNAVLNIIMCIVLVRKGVHNRVQDYKLKFCKSFHDRFIPDEEPTATTATKFNSSRSEKRVQNIQKNTFMITVQKNSKVLDVSGYLSNT